MPRRIESLISPLKNVCNPRAQETAKVVASIRFYAELNDFIVPEHRHREFELSAAGEAPIKHIIEALGVPHTEVELILINGVSVDFAQRLRQRDRVSVYPKFEAFDISPLLRLRPHPLRVTRFLADAHLGGLARLLRMAGFDTLYVNPLDDSEIVGVANRDNRIVLTRDRDLLKRRGISHGCYVHALIPGPQLSEIIARLDLAGSLRPFTLCLECNAPLRSVDKAQVIELLPPSVRKRHQQFSTCDVCRRVFWEGSHWSHMREQLATLVANAGSGHTDIFASRGEAP